MWTCREDVYDQLVVCEGHMYVCGDVTMAKSVREMLIRIIDEKSEKKITDNAIAIFQKIKVCQFSL